VITKNRNIFPILGANESNTNGEVYLSLVIPSYNEEKRLPPMLTETIEYLESRKKKDTKFTWEIIIVDDGSKDSTSRIGHSFAEKFPNSRIRVLTLQRNRGKGGAVKRVLFLNCKKKFPFPTGNVVRARNLHAHGRRRWCNQNS
jgi:cellulose synthase/poly-beta-1,6-N-acetylglucosamine synthase-like glycosyltransferase